MGRIWTDKEKGEDTLGENNSRNKGVEGRPVAAAWALLESQVGCDHFSQASNPCWERPGLGLCLWTCAPESEQLYGPSSTLPIMN